MPKGSEGKQNEKREEQEEDGGFDPKDRKEENAEKEGLTDSQYDEDGYFKYKLPWNINFSYSIAYGDYVFDKERLEFEQRLTQTLNFSGSFNFTDKWGFSFSSGYDFINKELSYTSCGIHRSLHCWSASLNFIPFGSNQGFNFFIGVNSSMLQDLKWEKRTTATDYPAWY